MFRASVCAPVSLCVPVSVCVLPVSVLCPLVRCVLVFQAEAGLGGAEKAVGGGGEAVRVVAEGGSWQRIGARPHA